MTHHPTLCDLLAEVGHAGAHPTRPSHSRCPGTLLAVIHREGAQRIATSQLTRRELEPAIEQMDPLEVHAAKHEAATARRHYGLQGGQP